MIRKLTLAVLFVLPVLALAVEPAADEEQPAAAEGDEAPEGAARAGEAATGAVPPPDTYTIRPGDTLWDLSGRFLNNPWYWPKVWSYNPEIANPHWIEPGSMLRFFQAGEEAPAQVAPVDVAEEEAEPVRELEDLARMSDSASAEEKDAVAVAGPYKIGYVAPRTLYATHDAFVTPRELEESGVLRAAFEERSLLATRDRAYATFRSPGAVKVGETYAIYRTVRKVKHPVTGDVLGYQSTIVGAGKVQAVEDKGVRLTIVSAYDAIERGDMLGPWIQKPYRAVPPKPNAKALRGYIVSAPIEILTQYAQHSIVFVDLGKAQGVEEGNRLTVVRSGDPRGSKTNVPKWDASLPAEDVGSLLVVDVKDTTSAALVTRSLSELGAGDRVEMRVAADAPK